MKPFGNIQDYLLKHYKLKPTAKIQRREVCAIIRRVSGILLDDNELIVSNNHVYLRTRPAKRSEILLCYTDILRECANQTSTQYIRMIR